MLPLAIWLPLLALLALTPTSHSLSCYQCNVGHSTTDGSLVYMETDDIETTLSSSCLVAAAVCEDPSSVGADMRCVWYSAVPSDTQDYTKVDLYGCLPQTNIDDGETLAEMVGLDTESVVLQDSCDSDECNFSVPPALSCPTCKSPYEDTCVSASATCEPQECESGVTQCYTRLLPGTCEVERGCWGLHITCDADTCRTCTADTCPTETGVNAVCAVCEEQITCPTCSLTYTEECEKKGEVTDPITCPAAECDPGVTGCFSVLNKGDQKIRLGCKPAEGDYKADKEEDIACQGSVCAVDTRKEMCAVLSAALSGAAPLRGGWSVLLSAVIAAIAITL